MPISGLDLGGTIEPVYGTGSTSGATPTQGASSIAPAERKKIEDLLAMLPNPLVMSSQFNTLLTQMPDLVGLGSVDSRVGATGTLENSVVMAALAKWAENIQDLATQEKKEGDKNAIEVALQRYLADHGDETANLDLINILRSSPLLLSSMQNVSPDVILSAYRDAEAQFIMSVLNKWAETEAKQLQDMREEDKRDYLANRGRAQLMFEQYLHEVQTGNAPLAQPYLSFMLIGMAGSNDVQVGLQVDPKTGKAMIDPNQDSILPLGQTVVFDSAKDLGQSAPIEMKGQLQNVAFDMAQLFQNVQISAAYWAIPGALTLLGGESVQNEKAVDSAAVRSYALAIAQFVMKPEFAKFVVGRILGGFPAGALSQDKIDKFVKTLQVTLLANALAALDKMALGVTEGGKLISTFNGAYFKGLIENPNMLSKDDLRYALALDIQTLLASMPTEDAKKMKQSLMTYFNTDPPISSLTDPATAFLTLFGSQLNKEVSTQQPT